MDIRGWGILVAGEMALAVRSYIYIYISICIVCQCLCICAEILCWTSKIKLWGKVYSGVLFRFGDPGSGKDYSSGLFKSPSYLFFTKMTGLSKPILNTHAPDEIHFGFPTLWRISVYIYIYIILMINYIYSFKKMINYIYMSIFVVSYILI